ncbi:hypothetical protein [Pseudomonas protegens]|uniref:hypothetical protein n=1 Tax=Pseudomonas protegens TaxID=380021 RepID=UPI00215D6B6A|nr:hypothetical protein [Pseudomonas protegens]
MNDADLRTLVARLALSELRGQGCPLSSVTAGGNQDAADGGLDVRVECPSSLLKADFVPRASTGYQVKKPDMPAGAIREEMRPKDVLRPVIAELAAASGAYIIVSAQGSVADKPLADRRKAIRSQLHDVANADELYTDFYDRDRLATWVNEYPGIAAWVRSRISFRLNGWSSIGDWVGTTVAEQGTYLFDDKACLTDERSYKREQLTISEGIAKLRMALGKPRQCIRLIGLSGLGKTRLVQALFESGVGEEPLDPSLAVYTDYSVETDPTARDMARNLVMQGQRVVLVVDNCNPATHSELAHICSDGASKVSLLTVEYDVRDDEPERTEVFRLQSASPELVSQWLVQSFPNVSQVDRRTIADFSDGNFRVASAIAETLGNGETLGRLKSRNLFERIFQQRNEPDQNLLFAAEELSLLYSVNGEDSSEDGELALIGSLRTVDAHALYAALAILHDRSVVQSRGRWRAVLPHAIANPLATYALKRIPPADFDRFCGSLTPRMRTSLSRRLGYLHDCAEAQAVVARWLQIDGPLGDLVSLGDAGFQIITNIAPVAPETVLARIERELESTNGEQIIALKAPARRQWFCLIKKLGYEPKMFERAAMLLARFVAVEPEGHNNNSAKRIFTELFHFYLSGTQAPPDQRFEVVRRLAKSVDPLLQRCALIALGALLKTDHFSSSSNFEFGARSRSWGWAPKVNRDTWDWYDTAIDLAVELSPFIDARGVLARQIRGLWSIGACHEALERASILLLKEKPWIEGWLGFRRVLRFKGEAMPHDVRAKIETIIQRLKPSDLLNQARAVVINCFKGLDIADCEIDDRNGVRSWEKASQMAQDIGRLLAQDAETRNVFIAELLSEERQQRSYECGRGIAEGADDLMAMWDEMAVQFALTDPKKRNATLLGGFIYQAHQLDTVLTLAMLEAAISDHDLVPNLPYLQACIGVDKDGIERLRRAVGLGVLQARDFYIIANGSVRNSPARELSALLLDIASLSDGVTIALEILYMHFYCVQDEGRPLSQLLIETGRDFLLRMDFSKKGGVFFDSCMESLLRICCSEEEGEITARSFCTRLCAAIESVPLCFHDVEHLLKGIFEAQPFIALDMFLLGEANPRNSNFLESDLDFCTSVKDVNPMILRQWANLDARVRFPKLGQAIPMFQLEQDEQGGECDGVASLFLELLKDAPDKYSFLGDIWRHIYPRSWVGSLADILIRRRAQVLKLREISDDEVRRWVDETLPELDGWIEDARKRGREREESFE